MPVGVNAAGDSSNYSFFWWRFKALLNRSGSLPMIGSVSLGSPRLSLTRRIARARQRTPWGP